jgi:hypothetical protein
MDPIERQQKRCYICLGYGHDQDDCPMKCENELNDLIPERHSAKLDRELEALQARHDELAELVRDYFDAKINLDARSIEHRLKNCAKTFQAKLNATHGMVKAETALRKAVEEG